MINNKICCGCDKVGECVMKCAALKRLETPYVIKMRGRGRGSVAKPDGTRGLTNEEATIYDNQLLSRSKSTGLEMKIND